MYPIYYIVELTVDVESPSNKRAYAKGVRVMVWEDSNLDCFWVVNASDTFKTSCAKKIYALTINECYNDTCQDNAQIS